MKKRRRMKAVSLVFEYTLLFMFGVIILLSSISVFMNYEGYFTRMGINDQLIEVREYIISNIIKLSEKEDCMDCSFRLSVPKKVGNEHYFIELSSQGINVTSGSGISKSSQIFNLTESGIELKGKAVSGAGRVIIYKTGNQIIIS
jgi:hypothetical protein